MTLLQMQYFRQVCTDKTVTQAAKALHVSQPAVSNAIQELEAELGVRLFHRIKLRLSLTLEGEYFLKEVAQLLNAVEGLEERMRDMGRKRNKIRIGVPPMIGTFMLPVILDSFQAAFPEIKVEIAETGSLSIREMLSQESLDIAIMSTSDERDSQYNTVKLRTTELLFCISKSHPLAARETISIQELGCEQLILFHDTFYVNNLIRGRFAEVNMEPDVLLSSDQLYTVKNLVLHKSCGAFLFREVLEWESDLIGIPLDVPITVDICMMWKRGKALYSDVSKLIRFMKERGNVFS